MGRASRSDAELVAASRRGEVAAFSSLVERYQRLVGAVSYAATGDRALSEDVTQETFLVAWTRLTDLGEPGKLRGWLCAIARNLGIKAQRRRGREVPAGAAVEAAGPSPFEATAEAESAQLVWESLRRIPATYREALVLYYQEGRSVAEVAAALGISEQAAMQRLSRGRRHLADGVTGLVERSLGRPPRNLVPAIVAALPAARPVSPTQASHGGSSMWKIAALITALAAAGGTVYLVHRSTGEPAAVAAAAPAPAPTPAATPRAVGDRPALPASAAAAPLPRPALPDSDEGRWVAPEPDRAARITGEALAALEHGPSRGPADAPVTIVLFSDFMCPFCERVVATVDQLFDEYPGKVRLVMKQFPVHEQARLAAEAALAADDQGKFWELHDMMMTNQDDLSRDALVGYARRVGIDAGRFADALDRHLYRDAVAADIDAGKQIDVHGTPAFLINGKLTTGAQPIEVFRAQIAAELAQR